MTAEHEPVTMTATAITPPPSPHARRIGARLRAIRRQQGLSLADVEESSGGRWKAVVVGAYERADRAASVERLAGLAAFYGVPLADLLPETTTGRAPADPDRLTLDLTAEGWDDPALAPVARFAQHVQQRRGDRNGRMLTLRGSDLDTIALTTGTTPQRLRRMLTERDVLIDADPDLPRVIHTAEDDERTLVR